MSTYYVADEEFCQFGTYSVQLARFDFWKNGFVFSVLMLLTLPVSANQSPKWQFDLALGAAWQNRNDVRIPGDTGTQFSLKDLVGSGPYPSVRFEGFYNIKGPHGLRLMLTPFEYTESTRRGDCINARNTVCQ